MLACHVVGLRLYKMKQANEQLTIVESQQIFFGKSVIISGSTQYVPVLSLNVSHRL